MGKAMLFTFFLFAFYTSFSQTKKDTLTNGKIVNMVKNGITDLLIKKSISTASYWSFDLSSDGIISLKTNKVSDSIIVSMFDKEAPAAKPANTSPVPSNGATNQSLSQSSDKNLNELDPGIYYESNVKAKLEYIRLNAATPATGFRTDPIVGISTKSEFTFIGKNAITQIKTSAPEFYLKVGNGYDNILYQPTQFIVLHASEKKGNRIISGRGGVGVGVTRNINQFDPKSIITPIFTRINDNLYKVTFEKKLPEGNYFFSSPIASTGKFLEFDINK